MVYKKSLISYNISSDTNIDYMYGLYTEKEIETLIYPVYLKVFKLDKSQFVKIVIEAIKFHLKSSNGYVSLIKVSDSKIKKYFCKVNYDIDIDYIILFSIKDLRNVDRSTFLREIMEQLMIEEY